MSMIADGLKYFAALAVQGMTPQGVNTGDPTKTVVALRGEIISFDRPSPPRMHGVQTLGDLITFATTKADPATSVIWFNEHDVVLVVDDFTQRDSRVHLALETSDVFDLVTGLADDVRWFSHREFIRMLRIELASALPASLLLDLVRRIKFTSAASTESISTRSKESLGREISQQVKAEGGEIPESVRLEVPVYTVSDIGGSCRLYCAVEVDMERAMFSLCPLPDEITRCKQWALGQIRERLASDLPSFPAFQGTP